MAVLLLSSPSLVVFSISSVASVSNPNGDIGQTTVSSMFVSTLWKQGKGNSPLPVLFKRLAATAIVDLFFHHASSFHPPYHFATERFQSLLSAEPSV